MQLLAFKMSDMYVCENYFFCLVISLLLLYHYNSYVVVDTQKKAFTLYGYTFNSMQYFADKDWF